MADDKSFSRSRELAARADSALIKDLLETYDQVTKGFSDQADRADKIQDYWDAYNCVLNKSQFYNGNSEIYVPIVRNAINARRTRFVNQLFPSSGKYIDATSSDGHLPRSILALLDHYVRATKLRSRIMAALLRNGDVEGQYNLYVGWESLRREVTRRRIGPVTDTLDGVEVELPGDEVESIDAEEVIFERPALEVLHDTDVLVLPTNVGSIEQALEEGSITIIRRWNKGKIKNLIAEGEIIKARGEALIEAMEGKSDRWNVEKRIQEAAGIRGGQAGKIAFIYETWKKYEVRGKRRVTRTYYGGDDLVLSCKLNPWWNDRCPLISEPVEKIAGSFKGQSPVDPVWTTQLHANDIANQAADATTFSMIPIVMTNPAMNPRTSTMVMNVGAVWEIDPNSTRFAEFPKLWQDGIQLIQADMQLIFQSLGVNPAMLPQQTGRPGLKRNQAEVALEQAVDLLTTAEACSVLEEGILTPLVERFVELDHQFRDQAITVKSYGEMGLPNQMEEVAPIQIGTHYEFTWFGVEQARSMQAMQQQIAWLNVARGMTAELQRSGYRLNPAPAMEVSAQNVFGARLGRLVLEDMRQQLSVDPQVENELLMQGFDVSVHPLDDDPKHIQAHAMALQSDMHGLVKAHLQKHQAQMMLKAEAMARQQMAQTMSGSGGARGTPPGAQPAAPRMLKGPPGMIRPDNLNRGPGVAMPRKM